MSHTVPTTPKTAAATHQDDIYYLLPNLESNDFHTISDVLVKGGIKNTEHLIIETFLQ